MGQTRCVGLFAACLLTAAASAQTLVSDVPPILGFVDISAFGGTPIIGVDDDTEHNIVTTVGNSLFPAGNVRIGNNGVIASGVTTGDLGFTNQTIAASGVPTSLPAGAAAYLCVLWDDHVPSPTPSGTTIYWREAEGVLYVLWKAEAHFNNAPGGQTTFELQVFGNPGCGPFFQFLYPDTFYTPGNQFNNGASATIGYVRGTNPTGANALFSFDAPNALPSGSIVSGIVSGAFAITPTSPFGPGSLRLDISGGGACGQYFLAVTLNQGTFPNGWLFGVDIPVLELVNEIAIGFPFVGILSGGSLTLGPFAGLPAFTFYAVGIALPYTGIHTPAISYTIP